MVIYFSKINLESVQLLDMYKEEELLIEMKRLVSSFLESGTIYETVEFQMGDDGEKHCYSTKYRISIGAKKDNYISGYLYKSSRVYYKIMNETTLQTESHFQPTIEDVRFYYDVDKEIVGFHTRNRFGYQEFNLAFKEILNTCMKKNNIDFSFDVSLYTEGLEIDEIEDELKKIKNIKRLEFKYKLPNPSDDFMLNDLANGLTDFSKDLEDANANAMSVIFDSQGGIGLRIDSPEIKKNLDRTGSLTRGISAKEASKNGYVLVSAIDKDGKKYTTEERKPIRREIDDTNEDEFFTACRETINIFIFK